MPYANNQGVPIYWEEDGIGEPLLLVTGLSFTLAMWGELRAILAGRFRTILLDNRGAGRTQTPPRPFTVRQMAGDAIAVLDAASVSSAHVLGLSMGGMIAQEVALRYPGRVRKLVLGCTHCGGRHSVLAEPKALALLSMPFWSKESRLKAMVPLIYDKGTPRDRIERDLAIIRANAPTVRGYVLQLAAIVRWHSYARLPAVQSRTLVIHGENDGLVPAANASILSSRIPSSKLILIPHASHIFPTDQPEMTCRALMDFLTTDGT